MSKRTYIICDKCQAIEGGVGYSTLWAKLFRKGWVAGENKTHYCPRCAAKQGRRAFQQKLQKTA